jgi:hypothetical protein
VIRCVEEDLEAPPVPGSVQGEIVRHRGAVGRISFNAKSREGGPGAWPLRTRRKQATNTVALTEIGRGNESSRPQGMLTKQDLLVTIALACRERGDRKVAATDT